MAYKDNEKQKAWQRDWYKRNKQKVADKVNVTRGRNKKFVNDWKASRGCKYCGESEPCCLDMHHHKQKNYGISALVYSQKPIKVIQEELEICMVVCSNCHRKIHAGLL